MCDAAGNRCSPESQRYSRIYLAGLLSNLAPKNAEAIAYRHDLDRRTLQAFVGSSPWDYNPLLDELNRQVACDLRRADARARLRPFRLPQEGRGLRRRHKRQYCGRNGKFDNCQIGIYLGYVTHVEHALVDFRLYLPGEWPKDRARRKRCGVPNEITYRTRPALALEMLDRRSGMLPHG
ncbi:transposase [Singulisphaera rosea]